MPGFGRLLQQLQFALALTTIVPLLAISYLILRYVSPEVLNSAGVSALLLAVMVLMLTGTRMVFRLISGGEVPAVPRAPVDLEERFRMMESRLSGEGRSIRHTIADATALIGAIPLLALGYIVVRYVLPHHTTESILVITLFVAVIILLGMRQIQQLIRRIIAVAAGAKIVRLETGVPKQDYGVDEIGELSTDLSRIATQLSTRSFELQQTKAFLECLPHPLLAVNTLGTITLANPAIKKLVGYDAAELVGKNVSSLFAECDDAERLPVHEGDGAMETVWRRKAGTEVPVSVRSGSLSQDGRKLGLVLVATDITERKRAEKALLKERDRAQRFLNVAGVMIIVIDANGAVILMNKKGCEVLGYEEKAITGRNWHDAVIPERIMSASRAGFRMLMEGRIRVAEYSECPVVTRSGEERIIAWHNIVLKDEEGDVVGTLNSGEDITERKRAEEQIKESLREKEVLLKEIHHRVKNNMQIISSILNLQSRRIKDKEALEMFRDSQNRIRSMSLIHENLYRARDLARIDSVEYVKSLARHLFSIYRVSSAAVKLNMDIGDVFLDINTAIPCGLIINELISNSLKHAFPDGRAGEISVSMRPVKGSEIELVVSDNGIGLPEDLDFRKAETLGLQLVSTLVEQIGGTMELEREGGTTVKIRFVRTNDNEARLK